MVKTFRGGVHVDEHKNTEGVAVVQLPAPALVSIPLSQHIGAPAEPTVSVGDLVLRGQVIGEVANGLGCPIHSSVSGKVQGIVEKTNPMGAKVRHVVIENDGSDALVDTVRIRGRELASTTSEEIVEIIRRAGISGMGGATFPTYAKLRSAIGKVDTMILNCAECEPFITANHRLILEHPEEVLGGMRVLLHALGLKKGMIGIEDNKPNAITLLRAMTADAEDIEVQVVRTKYPQGDERQLIYVLTGRQMPQGKLPADVGCVVFNTETAAAVYRAFQMDMPLIERIVTVDGDCIHTPKNLLVPLGTPYRALIDFCGGLVGAPRFLINGGPMMGFAQWDADAPVTKGTSAILVFSAKMEGGDDAHHDCIRCGRCVAHCPMHLMPNYMASLARMGRYEETEAYGLRSCVECGCCSYVCPAHVPLVQYIRVSKFALNQKKK